MLRFVSICSAAFCLLLTFNASAEQRDTEQSGERRERPVRPRAGEWQVQYSMGGEFFVFFDQVVGNGPSVRVSGIRLAWRGNLVFGGGPSFHYSFLIESDEPRDKIHQMTANGEFVIGGGIYEMFAVYFHLMVGGGGAHIYDGETATEGWIPWARAVGGIGGWVHITDTFSLGVLLDVGYPGIIDAFLTLDFHYSR